MLNRIVMRKLNSNEGASLMVALLFFVMCATIGSIILAAATASSGRLKNLKADDQAYYANSSAMNLLGELFSDSENAILIQHTIQTEENLNTGTSTLTVDKCAIRDFEKVYIAAQIKKNTYFVPQNLDKAFSNSETGLSGGFVSFGEFDISVSDDTDDALKVHVKVTMNPYYDLIAVLNPANYENNKMTVIFKSVKRIEDGIDEETSKTEEREGVPYRITTRIKNYILYWQKPEIYKGETS